MRCAQRNEAERDGTRRDETRRDETRRSAEKDSGGASDRVRGARSTRANRNDRGTFDALTVVLSDPPPHSDCAVDARLSCALRSGTKLNGTGREIVV